MIRCVVEMYGIAHDVTDLRDVEVELQDDAGLRDVITALRNRLPRLEGRVISAEEDRLMEHCAFNVGGSLCFDDAGIRLQDGDRIGLLTLASGG